VRLTVTSSDLHTAGLSTMHESI